MKANTKIGRFDSVFVGVEKYSVAPWHVGDVAVEFDTMSLRIMSTLP